MPVHFNDYLDDPLVADAQSSFSKGQVSNARANLLDTQQGALLRNVVLDYNGVVESRRGFRDFGDTTLSTATTSATGTALQGLFYYDTLNTEMLVAAVSGNLYKYDGTEWSALSATTANIATTGNVWFAQIADKLYFTSGGTKNVAEWDGTEVEPDVSTSATGLRNIVSHGFRLFGAANVDELWCSLILPDAGSDWLEDEDGDIITDEDGNRITAGYKTFFGSNATFRVGHGDGDRITALVPWSDFNLLVFKEGSTYAVNTNPAIATSAEATGTDVAQFIVRTISTRIGCASHRTAVQVDNDCFFLARDGVRSVARTIQDGTQGVSPALSYPVDDVIRRINWSAISVACAASWRGRYILAVPVDGSTTNNMILVYDTNLQAWVQWDGITPVEFCVTRFGGSPQKLVVLENNGNVLELRDWFGFEQSSPNDYADLTAYGGTIEDPANVSTSVEEYDNGKANMRALYRVSFRTAAGETAASDPVEVYESGPYPVPYVTWDAPAATGMTARVWRYVSENDDYTPNLSEYTLFDSVSADTGRSASDFDTLAVAQAEQASYTGDRPLLQDDFSSLAQSKPTIVVRTRALSFGDPISPKKPNHVEFEFDRSNAIIDAKLLVDGEEQSEWIASKVESGYGALHLPQVLPFKLSTNRVVRKRFNTDNFDPGREIQVEVVEAADLSTVQNEQSEYLRLREINASAFLETMEDQE